MYKSYSTRSASISKASAEGVDISDIMKRAKISATSTLLKFNKKPINDAPDPKISIEDRLPNGTD